MLATSAGGSGGDYCIPFARVPGVLLLLKRFVSYKVDKPVRQRCDTALVQIL